MIFFSMICCVSIDNEKPVYGDFNYQLLDLSNQSFRAAHRDRNLYICAFLEVSACVCL